MIMVGIPTGFWLEAISDAATQMAIRWRYLSLKGSRRTITMSLSAVFMRHFLLYVLLSSPSRIRHSGLPAHASTY